MSITTPQSASLNDTFEVRFDGLVDIEIDLFHKFVRRPATSYDAKRQSEGQQPDHESHVIS